MPTTAGSDANVLTVAGIGSPVSCDDGVGLVLVEALSATTHLPGVTTCLWEDADALTLAHRLLESGQPVLIVDCADMGLQHGCWRLFSEPDTGLKAQSRTLSTHGLGLAEALSIARALGFSQEVHIFGIQPFDLAPIGDLSAQMKGRLPGLLEALQGVVESLASARGGRTVSDSKRNPNPHGGAPGAVQ